MLGKDISSKFASFILYKGSLDLAQGESSRVWTTIVQLGINSYSYIA